MRNFNKKTVVITGAGGGIGRSLAEEFSKLGANLALNDFNANGLEETKRLINEKNPACKLYANAFDVSDPIAFTQFAENIISTFGSVDVVINNAGMAICRGKMVDIPLEDYYRIFDVNLRGVLNGSKIFLPYLLKQKEASLVNISSIFGIIAPPEQSPYVTTKFAVRGLNESLYLELKNSPVCVTSVHPGGIKTNIATNSKRIYNNKEEEDLLKLFNEKMLIATPDFAAKKIIKGIKNKKRKILVGKDAVFINFLNTIFPSLIRFFLKKSLDIGRKK